MAHRFIVSFARVKLQIALAPNAALDPHQTQTICKFAKQKQIRAIVWHRVGTGKTRIALILALLRCRKFPCVILIVARPKAEYDWQAEIQKLNCDAYFTTDCNSVSFRKPTFWFVSFASLGVFAKQICRCPWLTFVIIDELYLYGNPASKRSKALRKIVEGRNRIGIGGTIITATDNSQVWGQASAIGVQHKLARHFSSFRTIYQKHIQVDFGYGNCRKYRNAPNWKVNALARLQDHVSIYFPPVLQRVTEKVIKFPLSSEQTRLIHDLLTIYYMEYRGNTFDFKYAFQVYNKIRGILNGWITTEEGETCRVPSPKLDGLIASLHELHDVGEPCLVWCAFRNDIKVIQAELKFATLQMVGGKEFDLARFNSMRAPIVLATMGSGASVNHFRNMAQAKFFSLSYKPLDLEQAKGRQTRRDSTTTGICYEYYEAGDSYDEIIRCNLESTQVEQQTLIQTWHKQILRTFTPK